jgi:hypothetical protein
MKSIKYNIHPGIMLSKNDGDVHYISGPTLIRLYGVNPSECTIISPDMEHFMDKTLINLGPRYHGDYTLTTINEEQQR